MKHLLMFSLLVGTLFTGVAKSDAAVVVVPGAYYRVVYRPAYPVYWAPRYRFGYPVRPWVGRGFYRYGPRPFYPVRFAPVGYGWRVR